MCLVCGGQEALRLKFVRVWTGTSLSNEETLSEALPSGKRRGVVFQWEEKMFCIEKGEPLFVGEGKVYFSKGRSFPVKGETFPCQRGKQFTVRRGNVSLLEDEVFPWKFGKRFPINWGNVSLLVGETVPFYWKKCLP